MKTPIKIFALAAVISVAFVFSCSSDEPEQPPGIVKNDVSSSSKQVGYAFCVSPEAKECPSPLHDCPLLDYYFDTQQCLLGPFAECPSGYLLSNDCPIKKSSSSRIPTSSSSFEVTEMPIMDSRILSYKVLAATWKSSAMWEPEMSLTGFVTDKDILKPFFPHIFENEQPECNYFAIYFIVSSQQYEYKILSQDMILYSIKPGGRGSSSLFVCPTHAGPTNFGYTAMLVCDDTAEGNLMDKIDLNFTPVYGDLDWDCNETETQRGAYF